MEMKSCNFSIVSVITTRTFINISNYKFCTNNYCLQIAKAKGPVINYRGWGGGGAGGKRGGSDILVHEKKRGPNLTTCPA
jgi:hypothetical protein